MIKVCHIVNLITGKSDGVYAHLKMILRNFDKLKFEHIVIFQGEEKVEKELKELGVQIFVSESLKKKISFKAFFDIYKVVHDKKVDIIHTHLIKPYAIAGLVNIFLKKKIIYNYHGIFLKNNPYYNFIERRIYLLIHYIIYLFGRIDVVLVPSEFSKQILTEETKLFPEAAVYYNGCISIKNFTSVKSNITQRIEASKQDKSIIALVGRLEIDKRIDQALILIRNLVEKNFKVHLMVFGNGSLKDELNQLIQQYKLNDSVDILDYIENVESYYKYFDIVLFTSDWEGMPLTMWEAMANGIAIVAADVGGFKEILEKNNCGRIYERGNIMEAEVKLIQLLDDLKLRKLLGKNGSDAIETKYNIKNFINQIEQVYLNLLS